MTNKEMTNEIENLIVTYKNGEISYKDLYFALQKYPTAVKDSVLALHILNK